MKIYSILHREIQHRMIPTGVLSSQYNSPEQRAINFKKVVASLVVFSIMCLTKEKCIFAHTQNLAHYLNKMRKAQSWACSF